MERALLAEMDILGKQGSPISHNTILDLIQRCSKAKTLTASKKLYHILLKNSLDVNTIVCNHLIRMFTSCCSLEHADTVFYRVTKPDTYTWNAIISAHAKLGRFDHAFYLYQRLRKTNIKPNNVTFLCILKACACSKALPQGRLAHDHVIRNGVTGVLAIGNTLIDMYANCGSLEEAERVFERVTNRDVVTWGVMATAYAQRELGIRALELFEKMHQSATEPSKVVFLSVLKACLIVVSLVYGRQIHDDIVRSSLDLDMQVGSRLIQLYSKCGSLHEAQSVFYRLPNRDVVVWCSLIAAYTERGYNLQVLELFEDMQKATIEPDRVTFIYVLKACGGMGTFEHGCLIHNGLVRSSLESDRTVANSLIDMYNKLGDFKGAFSIFYRLSDPDEVSWGSMITGYVHHGYDDLALRLYEDMHRKHMKPDKPILILVLKASGNVGDFETGSLIHQALVESGMESDVMVGKTLIDMYGKCAGLEEATRVFDRISNKNVDLWDALIAAYSSYNEQSLKALELFEKLQQQVLKPSKGVLLCILKVCGVAKAVREGKCLHDGLIRRELELGEVMENTIIDMYAKCGLLEEACCVFSRLTKPNEVSWGAMIAGYVSHGKSFSALRLFERMQLAGMEANAVVSSCILKACGDIGTSKKGRLVHDKVIRSGLVTNDVWNTLVHMYAKCGSMDEAQKVFDRISSKSLTSWSMLIAGYTQHGSGLIALDLYKKMILANVKPNEAVLLCILQACGITGALMEGRLAFMQISEDGFELDALLGNTLLDMYTKCGSMQEACYVFARLPKRDMVSWGVLMAGFVRNNECREVEGCFELMKQEGLKAGDFIFTSILAACSHGGLLNEGLKYFTLMTVDCGILPERKHYSCISDLLGRAGYFWEAVDLLRSMPMPPDLILWTSLLDHCKNHDNKRLGSRCFEELLHADPDDASWYVLMSRMCASATDSSAEVQREENIKHLRDRHINASKIV